MASVKKWTAAARNQHGSGVLAATPASSKPLGKGLAVEAAVDSIFLGWVGLAFTGVVLGYKGLEHTYRRIRHREERAGTRGINDLVALLFYEDLVEVRGRQRLRKTTGELLEWHPLEEVTYFDSSGIRVGGTEWLLSDGYRRDLEIALTNVGVEIETEEAEDD